MARVLRFFPRQVMMADAATPTQWVSDIYDVSNYFALTVVVRVFAESNPVSVSATLEQTTEPQLGPDSSWDALPLAIPGVAYPNAMVTPFINLQRFVRVVVLIANGAGNNVMLSVEGIAREST